MESVSRAETVRDTATLCLALERLSRLYANVDHDELLNYARKAESIYTHYTKANSTNKIYYKLQTCVCLKRIGRLGQAARKCKEALNDAIRLGDSLTTADCCHNLSLIYNEAGVYDSALYMARRMAEYNKHLSAEGRMVLAEAFLNIDSIEKAKEHYKAALGECNYENQRYTVYYYLHKAAILGGEQKSALEYLDSTFHAIEQMYAESLSKRNEYYTAAMEREMREANAKHHATIAKWISAFVSMLLIFCILTLYQNQRNSKIKLQAEQEKSRIQMEHEKELYDQKMEIEAEHHALELERRDLHIGLMQKYLSQKIAIAQQIETIKGEAAKKNVFTDKDWTDIEGYLDAMHGMFVHRLRKQFPCLREKDIHLMMLIRLKVSSRTLADLYGISEKSIRQNLYLYKKKLGIEDTDISLREYIDSY